MNARVCLAFGLSLVAAYAQTPYPPATPFVRIETGMHTAKIQAIDMDAADHFLVTASLDNTARVWDLKTGKLLQVLRPPQGADEGGLNAVALSPDGNTVAVGGWTGQGNGPFSVYLFDRSSGTLIRHIPGFPSPILHLAYSSDGHFLAVALARKGLRVYRSPDYTEAAQDSDYTDNCAWAEFDRTGRLVTAGDDGFVRLYDKNFRLIAKKQEPGGKLPFSARFSPDGTKIAVGFSDARAVNLLSASDLSFLSAPPAPASGGNFGRVAWSRDGQTLYAAGTFRNAAGFNQVAVWHDLNSQATYWTATGDPITDLRTLSDGRIALGSFDPMVVVLDQRGQVSWQQLPEILLYTSPAGLVRLSPDGSTVEFRCFPSPQSYRQSVGRFDLARRQSALDVTSDPTLKEPRTTGLDISGWNLTTHPALNGRALPLLPSETSTSLAIAGNGNSFLLGSIWYLRLFASDGTLKWAAPVRDAAWAVNLTADGRYAVAAIGDGTLHWYRTENGQEVMGLFVDHDGKRWVLWTPEGFFDCSENADSLIGYHLNHGPDHEGEFVRAEQFKNLFYRPDLLAQRLKPEGDKLMREALNQIGDVSAVLHSGSPPDLALLSPAESDSDGRFALQFKIVDRGGGVGRIVYRIDGSEMEGRAVAPVGGKDTVALQFDLPPGRHTASVTVYNRAGQLESRSISSVVNVKQSEQPPALYVLAVGISKYRDNSLNQGVRFAAADADTIAARLQQLGTGLFRQVTTYVLKDADASRNNIEKTVSQIAAKIHPADEFVFYLAGHGTAIKGEYIFVPWNAIYSGGDALHDQSLNEERLQSLLKSIPASKTLLLLDTCSAGSAITGRDPQITEKGSIERLSKLTGRATLAASSSDQMALEGYENHGVFTFALLEGLLSAVDKAGLIQVSTLADYIEERVPRITSQRWGYEQFPMRLIQGQTFPIAKKQ